MNARAQSAGSAGFTLIESMIAMFFLSFIVAEMGMVFVYASRNTNLAQRITRANALADEAIEKSRNTAYESLQLANVALAEGCVTAGTVATCTSTVDGRFTRVRRVSPFDKDWNPIVLPSSNRSEIDVVVSFADAKGVPQTLRVASIVTRY